MMTSVVRNTVLAFLAISALTACDDPATSLADAQPATGAQLQEFSKQWNDSIELSKAGPLLQRFCVNASGAACAPDTIDQLKQYGFGEGATTSDLAYSFIRMTADAKDGAADQQASDEDFVSSCYRVMLGREPDAEGAAHHLGSVRGQGEDARKALARAFLRVPEFASQG